MPDLAARLLEPEAGWPAMSIAWRTAATSLMTPVDFSLWTIATALIACVASARRRSYTSSPLTPLPHSVATSSTSVPSRQPRSAYPRPK